MTSPWSVLAALALWPSPLCAQIGLVSAGTTVALSATKAASVSVSLPGDSSANLPGALVSGQNDFAPVPVTTAWEVDPRRTSTVALVAYFEQPARARAGVAVPSSAVPGHAPSGGPKAFAPFLGAPLSAGNTRAGTGPRAAAGTLVLFTQAISGANAVGRRTDDLQVRDGRLNLLVITQ